MDIARKKRRGVGYKSADRDHSKFYRAATKKLDILEKQHISDKETYSKYLDPNLIFKIKLTQNVSDSNFRKELQRVGIHTLSSTSGKNGYHVVFTSNVHLIKFRQKLEERMGKDTATFVDAIGGIEEIPQEEKLGASLQAYSLQESDMEHIDVEIWKMKRNRRDKFITGFKTFITSNGGEIIDTLLTQDFFVMRILMDKNLLDAITALREVAHADRPAVVSFRKQLDADIREIDIEGPPPKDSPGILVVDSGIRHHPLLRDSIADSIVLLKKGNRTVADIDDVGHGTQVAGIALYGDIGSRAGKSFAPRLWLYSAKVMYDDGTGCAKYDEDQLLEHQFKDAVERTISKHKNCRIINVSLGNSYNKMFEKQRQFRLASLIDELSFRHKDVIFTVAAGNSYDDVFEHESYPEYMLENSPRVKIIDPATSAHALTVGASFQFWKSEQIATSTWPSPFTRVGPGLNGMIKPELVANGGGYSPDLPTINPQWIQDGRLFTFGIGTSLSSPLVAHHLGILKGKFPSESRNMLKALVLSSTIIPQEKPPGLEKIAKSHQSDEMQKILNIFGYGVPNLKYALNSNPNRVLLKYDGKIPLDRVHFFAVMMPKIFVTKNGRRSIAISLVFDPPTNSNRADYLGVSMYFHLFRDLPLKTIKKLYLEKKKNHSAPDTLQKKQIKMSPSFNIRNRGMHQKAIQTWSRRPKFDISEPLVLAVTCQNRWHPQNGYEQPYAVVMTIRHEKSIDIYNPIRVANKMRIRVQSRV